MKLQMREGRKEIRRLSSDPPSEACMKPGNAKQKMIKPRMKIAGAVNPVTRSQVDITSLQEKNIKPTTRARIITNRDSNLLTILRIVKQVFMCSSFDMINNYDDNYFYFS